MKKGFSLIELLISLIVISVVTAAFAPIMTKKIKQRNLTISNGKQEISLECPPEMGSDCITCLGNQCINCPESVKNECKEGNYFDFSLCKCSACTDTNCASCTADLTTCSVCKEGYEKNSSGDCEKEKIKCKHGEIEKEGVCINPCAGYHNSFFIPTDSDNRKGICMTKINAGDDTSTDTPQIPSKIGSNTVTMTNAKSSSTGSKSQGVYRCWKATSSVNTAADGCTSATGTSIIPVENGYNIFSYNSCTRTLCTWEVAKGICENFYSGWRLPKNAELEYISKNIDSINTRLGSNGLQLCDGDGSSYGAPYCKYNMNCPYANNGCYPYFIWSNEESSGYSDFADLGQLCKGSFIKNRFYKANGASVRCVHEVTY